MEAVYEDLFVGVGCCEEGQGGVRDGDPGPGEGMRREVGERGEFHYCGGSAPMGYADASMVLPAVGSDAGKDLEA